MICLQSKDSLLDYIAENGYIDRQKVAVNTNGRHRRYVCYRCQWCNKPTLKRSDSPSETEQAFCSRWCEGRSKSDDIGNRKQQNGRCPQWWRLRERVLERDDGRCQYCGRPRGLLERRPQVVSVGQTDNQNEETHVSLCRGCLERNRDKKEDMALQALGDGPFDSEHDYVLCPNDECSSKSPDSWFETRGDMHVHHTLAHGESLVTEEAECEECGEVFEYYPRNNGGIHCVECREELRVGEPAACQNCGEEFTSLGMHWSTSSCPYPTISDQQMDILRGMLMGDAYIQKSKYGETKNAALEWKLSNKKFMSSLDEKLRTIARGKHRLCRTKEEAAETAENAGIVDNADPKDYKKAYRNGTRRHPSMNIFEENWITNNGDKRFPLDRIELTPTVLRYWFVCDGTLNRGNIKPRARISSMNEVDRFEEIADMIEDAVGVRPNPAPQSHNLQFNTEESRAFFDYIGWEPLPGFEYKWADKGEYR